jgi:hypothetical protein
MEGTQWNHKLILLNITTKALWAWTFRQVESGLLKFALHSFSVTPNKNDNDALPFIHHTETTVYISW